MGLRRKPTLVMLAAAALVAVPAAVAALDGTATVRFGNPGAGTVFPPPSGHDASFNGQDNLIPRTSVIAAGGSVTFAIDGFHQPAIYEPGTTPADIALPAAGDFVDDPDGRIAIGPLNFPPATTSWTSPSGTFARPGRYLLICNFLPHFAFAKMYGWVQVK